MKHDIEPLLRRGQHEVFRELVKLLFGGRKWVLATGIARTQAGEADIIGHLYHMKLMGRAGLVQKSA